jgi:site-specific recombinase XerD
MAVDLLQEGAIVDRSTIALWLGHQHVQTTQIYLDATLAMKEKAVERVNPHQGQPSRYRADDRLLAFLKNL